MGRRIVTVEYQATGSHGQVDTYFDRVVKYIPADVVSAWVFLTAAVKGAPETVSRPLILWLAFGIGLVLTALWTHRQTTEDGKSPAFTQILISVGAFAVWVFALGGPFETLAWHEPFYGPLLLVLYTLVVALVIPKDDAKPK